MNPKREDALHLLTNEQSSKDAYRAMIAETVEAILASFTESTAYSGKTPQQLQQLIERPTLLPAQGLGFSQLLKEVERTILPNFLRTSSTDYLAHLHSPPLLESIASELILATFNQSMDSWDQAPIATEIELQVTRALCELYGYDKGSDGIFTSGGSQSNLSALMLARDWFCSTELKHDVKKLGLPPSYAKLRIYTSEVSHFSMEKSAHLLGLGYDAVRKVPTDKLCRMESQALEDLILLDKAAGLIPFCVVATLGTTDYGSIDPLNELGSICTKYNLWLHADAAYGSGVRLSKRYSHRLGPIEQCDSITVDFHKMFLLPISCGAFLVKDGKGLEAFSLHADYLNREEDEEDGYTNLVGKSMQTTRRFDALKVWMAFLTRGRDEYGAIIDTCIENATYLYERLAGNPSFEVAIEPEISSVVFRLHSSDEVNKRVRRLLLHKKGVVIGQTVYAQKTFLKFTLLNPLLDHKKLDELLLLIEHLGREADAH
ncbi:MAG: aspartate aminotransferase family protein [Sphaerochaeta sp.]|nr:aspartate aminotransferase family protein [Sphaerochaeta sp.]